MPGRAIRIAIVNDDEESWDCIEAYLSAAGYDVAAFGSGREFLESALMYDVDCAVVDVRLPEMDGLELQARLKLLRPELSVIFLTAFDDRARRQLALARGAAAWFRKPCDSEKLVASVQSATARHSSAV